MNNSFVNFTRLESFYKTVRFELKPIGKTSANLHDMMEGDRLRAEKYPLAKKEIDDFYRKVIKDQLGGYEIDFSDLYDAMEEKDQKKLNEIKDKHRKDISNQLKAQCREDLFKNAELFKIIKSSYDKNDKNKFEQSALNAFARFTTYFKGFAKNRENVFTGEAISTSIAYRIVDVNFPLYAKNYKQILNIKENNPEILEELDFNMKKLGVIDEDDIVINHFTIDAYSNYLLQDDGNGRGINFYNLLLGGVTLEGGEKIQGLNEIINLHNQKNKGKRIGRLVPMQKQILSDEARSGFRFDIIEDNEKLRAEIEDYYNVFLENDIIGKYTELLNKLDQFDLTKIVISEALLNSISVKYLGNYSAIKGYMLKVLKNRELYEKNKGKKKKINLEDKDLSKIYSKLNISEDLTSKDKVKYYRIKIIDYLCEYEDENLENGLKTKTGDNFNFINSLREYLLDIVDFSKDGKIDRVEMISQLLETVDVEDINSEQNILNIKSFLDMVLVIDRHLKSFVDKDQLDIDVDFYDVIKGLSEVTKNGVSLLNKVRNYVTKKKYSTDKMLIKFDIGGSGDGWSLSKESTNKTVILRKDGLYYLAIIKKDVKLDLNKLTEGDENYEKMVYSILDISRHFPKAFLAKKYGILEFFANNEKENSFVVKKDSIEKSWEVSREFIEAYILYKGDEEKKDGKNFLEKHGVLIKKILNIDELSDIKSIKKDNIQKILIDGYKDLLKCHKSTMNCDFRGLRPTEEYKNLTEFTKDTENYTYTVGFKNISKKAVDELVEKGDLLLFQIYNKDFAKGKTGKDNLHTMYWKALFSEENLKKPIFKLSGGAELFFRKKSIKDPVVHKKGDIRVPKTYEEDGAIKSIPDESYLNICEYARGNKDALDEVDIDFYNKIKDRITEFTHDIVKDERYTVDKYFFHCPIEMNRGAGNADINQLVINEIKAGDLNVIGIDRGERNLIYISVIDTKGNILEQKDMNIINGFDYLTKLENESKRRADARRSWKEIGNIKDLKRGYISMLVHEVAKLAIKYNAVIVMENLNQGFKRSRLKFEQQIYQKFEKQLVDKLYYFVFKDREPCELGGVLNGYQLAPPFKQDAFQNGILLYVNPWLTSAIDTTTGFVNIFKGLSNFSASQKRSFIEKMDDIRYSAKEDMFIYSVDMSKFEASVTTGKHWDIYTNGLRISYDVTKRAADNIDLTKELKNKLDDLNIDYKDERSLKDEILNNSALISKFFWIFRLAIQLRNSNRSTGEDYILSPVKNKDGEFFDTRCARSNYPKDADANGAYHIALKGMLLMNKIKDYQDYKDYKVTNEEWLRYMQEEHGRDN